MWKKSPWMDQLVYVCFFFFTNEKHVLPSDNVTIEPASSGEQHASGQRMAGGSSGQFQTKEIDVNSGEEIPRGDSTADVTDEENLEQTSSSNSSTGKDPGVRGLRRKLKVNTGGIPAHNTATDNVPSNATKLARGHLSDAVEKFSRVKHSGQTRRHVVGDGTQARESSSGNAQVSEILPDGPARGGRNLQPPSRASMGKKAAKTTFTDQAMEEMGSSPTEIVVKVRETDDFQSHLPEEALRGNSTMKTAHKYSKRPKGHPTELDVNKNWVNHKSMSRPGKVISSMPKEATGSEDQHNIVPHTYSGKPEAIRAVFNSKKQSMLPRGNDSEGIAGDAEGSDKVKKLRTSFTKVTRENNVEEKQPIHQVARTEWQLSKQNSKLDSNHRRAKNTLIKERREDSVSEDIKVDFKSAFRTLPKENGMQRHRPIDGDTKVQGSVVHSPQKSANSKVQRTGERTEETVAENNANDRRFPSSKSTSNKAHKINTSLHYFSNSGKFSTTHEGSRDPPGTKHVHSSVSRPAGKESFTRYLGKNMSGKVRDGRSNGDSMNRTSIRGTGTKLEQRQTINHREIVRPEEEDMAGSFVENDHKKINPDSHNLTFKRKRTDKDTNGMDRFHGKGRKHKAAITVMQTMRGAASINAEQPAVHSTKNLPEQKPSLHTRQTNAEEPIINLSSKKVDMGSKRKTERDYARTAALKKNRPHSHLGDKDNFSGHTDREVAVRKYPSRRKERSRHGHQVLKSSKRERGSLAQRKGHGSESPTGKTTGKQHESKHFLAPKEKDIQGMQNHILTSADDLTLNRLSMRGWSSLTKALFTLRVQAQCSSTTIGGH